MSRITSCFETLKKAKQKALIPFIAAGDPNPEVTPQLMHQLVEGGADLIEIGMPFSDPMADGPVIQAAYERALTKGTSLNVVLNCIAEFRKQNKTTPVVLMGYLNPIEQMGYQAFADKAFDAGVDGCLIVDSPPEENEALQKTLKAKQLDLIYLLSLTTANERIKLISQQGSGFLYLVSLKGITGANHLDVPAVKAAIKNIQSHTNLPIGVGFGIQDATSAKAIASTADAIIIGSPLVKIISQHIEKPEKSFPILKNFLKEIKEAMRA